MEEIIMEKFLAYYQKDGGERFYVRDEEEMAIVVIADDFEAAEEAFKNAIHNMLSGTYTDDEMDGLPDFNFAVTRAENDRHYTYVEGYGFKEYNYDEF